MILLDNTNIIITFCSLLSNFCWIAMSWMEQFYHRLEKWKSWKRYSFLIISWLAWFHINFSMPCSWCLWICLYFSKWCKQISKSCLLPFITCIWKIQTIISLRQAYICKENLKKTSILNSCSFNELLFSFENRTYY